MTVQQLPFMPQFFNRYIELVEPEIDLLKALATFDKTWIAQFQPEFVALEDKVYAPGKWTVRDMLQHLVDTERIMSYRALRISRGDETQLPGFDEDAFARNINSSQRGISDLLTEFDLVRQSSIMLFKNMTDTMLTRTGTASNQLITPLALGLTIVGHPIHHLNVFKERYFPLIER